MPDLITDVPPTDVAAQVAAYVAALDQVVPEKRNQNLLIGTWNVRAFNRLTPKWRSVAGQSPLRDLSNVLCIAETLRRFDVVEVQEVGPDPEAFLATLQALGSGWAFLLTDVVLGDLGHSERLAFVFDQPRLRPSGLACELVVSPEEAGVSTDVLGRQFARTPYAVSFARDARVFTLVTLHVIYGNEANDRVGELQAQDLPTPGGVHAGRDERGAALDPTRFPDLQGERVEPQVGVGTAVERSVPKAVTASSRSLAISETRDLEMRSIPRVLTNPSTRRVETPLT